MDNFIVTNDGSPTFRSLKVGELYHSKSGALEESFEKYCNALKIWEVSKPVIFDVCFGIGYNSAAAIDTALKHNLDFLEIHCFENDINILRKVLDVSPDFENYDVIKCFIKGVLNGVYIYETSKVKLKMYLGDARILIKEVDVNADFIFFDPFSPKKDPELWSKEFFCDIYSKTKSDGKLATYSYARVVKDNLASAGFRVFPGPVIGRRSPSTIALK